MKASQINLDREYADNEQHSGHRRPSVAGSSDRYYGRNWQPNFTYKGYTYYRHEMTEDQVNEYTAAWKNETDRKDWGGDIDADCREEA